MNTDASNEISSIPQDLDSLDWRPLSSVERRVLGVMVEKSKTTPDIYPMTINAITTASNQKSNRKPQMQLAVDEVQDALDSLRESGVVTEIHGDGRTAKFKHRLYTWLGVERVELAVLAELLLRGEQTLGDLRGRSSRMEKIADLSELRPVIESLTNKNLVLGLTPPGRGQVVTHNLYQPEQLAKLRGQYGETSLAKNAVKETGPKKEVPISEPLQEESSQRFDESTDRWHQLQQEIDALQARVTLLEELLDG